MKIIKIKIEYKIQIVLKSSQKSSLGIFVMHVHVLFVFSSVWLFYVVLTYLICYFCFVNLLYFFFFIFIVYFFGRGAVQYLPSYQEKYHMEKNLYVTLSWRLVVPSHPPRETSNWNNDGGLNRK